jgi:phosphoribosylanthranilate isomerase
MTPPAFDQSRPVVKICGIRDVDAAAIAWRAGADLLGFMLVDTSRRKVAPDLIREVRKHLALGKEPPLLVGVTVNERPQALADIVERGQVDVVQLSGDELPEVLDDVEIPVIKTLHVNGGMGVDYLRRRAEAWLDHPRPVWAFLIDAKVDGHYGGTGIRTDWTLAALMAEQYPVILAGGLTPGNVAEAISTVQPIGVDVSSGVEIDGVKDHTLIETFVTRARQTFTALKG